MDVGPAGQNSSPSGNKNHSKNRQNFNKKATHEVAFGGGCAGKSESDSCLQILLLSGKDQLALRERMAINYFAPETFGCSW